MYTLWRFAHDFYEEEKFRLLHFVPVIFGFGICFYFYLDNEPSFLCLIFLSIALFILSLITKSKLSYICLIFCLGTFAAQLRTITVNTLIRNITDTNPVSFYATIESCNHTENGMNFIVKDISLPYYLDKLSLTWKGSKAVEDATNYCPGNRISIFAELSSLKNPAFPEQYDFKRQQYFNGISAKGIILSEPHKIEHYFKLDTLSLKIEKFRHSINKKIEQVLDKDIASIAKALITGTKSGIGKELRKNFVKCGTAHILAISGLHIGIIGFFIFWLGRILLNLFPIISMFCNVKKIAAAFSLIGVIFYYLISGCSVSALRALIMHSLIIIGIFTDRRALTMRSVAIAAMIILIISPEVIMFPSFQLSFSAVIAIVAFYEQHWNFSPKFKMLLNIIATTVVASAATSIFSIFIFNQLTLNSIFANIFAIPFMTFFIMPVAVISFIFLLVNVTFPLKILAIGISGLISIINFFSKLPGSLFTMPTPSNSTMLILICSSLILTLIHHRIRFLGLVGLLLGCLTYASTERPQIIISPEAKAFGIKVSDNLICCNHCGYFRSILSSWAKSVGCEKRENLKSKTCKKFIQQTDDNSYLIKLNDKLIKLTSNPKENDSSPVIYLDKTKTFTREIYVPSLKETSIEKRNRPWNY